MGWLELAKNGRKIKKLPVTHGGRRRRRFPSSILACPAAVGHEILWPRSFGGGDPLCPARVH